MIQESRRRNSTNKLKELVTSPTYPRIIAIIIIILIIGRVYNYIILQLILLLPTLLLIPTTRRETTALTRNRIERASSREISQWTRSARGATV